MIVGDGYEVVEWVDARQLHKIPAGMTVAIGKDGFNIAACVSVQSVAHLDGRGQFAERLIPTGPVFELIFRQSFLT